MNKPRIIKDYDKLSDDIIAQIKLENPRGFEKKLIQFKNREGKFVSALPFEASDFYYLIRMTKQEAQEIIEEDEDFDDDGFLLEEAEERLNESLAQEDDEDE